MCIRDREEGTQEDGEGQPVWKVPRTFELPFEAVPAAPVAVSDSFSHEENRLGLTWQWNHNPIPSCWSFTERPGWLRLQTGHVASGLMDARNTLTQRTAEPGCICEPVSYTHLDVYKRQPILRLIQPPMRIQSFVTEK